MKETPILVTGAHGGSVGYQILACLRKFSKRYKIIATDVYDFSAGAFKADKAYIVPFATDKKYIKRLLEIAKNEKVKAILPGSQQELVKIAQSEDLFSSFGIKTITNRSGLIEEIEDKNSQYLLLQKFGFKIPKYLKISKKLPRKIPFDFPLILKPAKAHSGSRNVYIVEDYQELKAIFQLKNRTKTEILLQEYIGTPEDEYTVGVVSDRDGRVIDAIVMKRKLVGLSLSIERTIDGQKYAVSSGVSQGIFIEDETIKNYCIDVASKVRSRGPLNIQLRMTKEGPKIFEFHARFSGSASQRAEAGLNEPDILVRNFCFGEKFNKIRHKKDIVVIRYVDNIVVNKKHLDKFMKEKKLKMR